MYCGWKIKPSRLYFYLFCQNFSILFLHFANANAHSKDQSFSNKHVD